LGHDGGVPQQGSGQLQQSPRYPTGRRECRGYLFRCAYNLTDPVSQITAGKMLEDEVPVFVVTFATQEVLCFKNAKSGEVIVGAEDRVEQCHYAAVITRIEEEIENELTAGWKIVEMARRSARAYL